MFFRSLLLTAVFLAACGTPTTQNTDAGSEAGRCGPAMSMGQPEARGDSAGGVDPMTGHLFLFGGDVGPTRMCIPAPEFRDDTWSYDPQCDRWRRIEATEKPSARSRAAYAVDTRRRRLVLFGGRYRMGSSGNYTLLRDVWALDFATGQWSQLTTTGGMPSARSNSAATYDALRDEFILFGGNTSTSGASFSPQGDLWILSMESLAWRRVTFTDGPSPRLFHSVLAVGENLWLYGGGGANAFTGPFNTDVWRYDRNTMIWSQVQLAGENDALAGRISATMLPGRDGVVIVAGHDDGQLGNRNDVLNVNERGGVTALRVGDVINRPGNGFCDFPADFTTPDMQAPERRSAFIAGLLPDGMNALVYGGKTDCGLAGDVWSVNLTTGVWTTVRGTSDGLSCARSGRMGCSALCQ